MVIKEILEEGKNKPSSYYEPKYVCINCGHVVSFRDLQVKILCPRCGKKIFFKLRPDDRIRIIKAR